MQKILFVLSVIALSCGQPEISAKGDLNETSVDHTPIPGLNKEDTVGLYMSPLVVIKSEMLKTESKANTVKLTLKNVSSKKITAFRAAWWVVTAFNKPLNNGDTLPGRGTGTSEKEIAPGAEFSDEWYIGSNDANRVKLAYPYEVAFDDGTNWVLKK